MAKVIFGKMLKQIRLEHNYTQAKLANLLHVTDRAIRGWENEDIEPSYNTLVETAQILGVTVGQLLGTEEYY
jgi:transcriptional regulator with XRE-family HTH domain